MKMGVEVSEDEVNKFQEDGALHIRGAFSQYWVDKIRAGIQVAQDCHSVSSRLASYSSLGLASRYFRSGIQVPLGWH